MYYVAVDIGCIECGENSNVLGIFTDEERAKVVCTEHEERQKKNWRGEHLYEVFPMDEIDVVNTVTYNGGFDQSGRY